MIMTSQRERLDTFGSHPTNSMLVFMPTHKHSAWSPFTTALKRWYEASTINKANGYWPVAGKRDMVWLY